MSIAILSILVGLVLLVWSADHFIEGAAATAGHAGMPTLLIGMVIVGFGTSAPEMIVSAVAALDGNSDLALGNALGSNIVNSGLILGVTALVAPLAVHSRIVRRELPLLLCIALLLGGLLLDGDLSRSESLVLLAGFFALIAWTVREGLRHRDDVIAGEIDQELAGHAMPPGKALFWLVAGLILLIASSRILVWGAVSVATAIGISDLIIGLTIVALGTSLPELAASVIAARRGEYEIAIGNVVGSNMFNLLAVVGIAGALEPMPHVIADVMSRDWPVMVMLTLAVLVMTIGLGRPGRINRLEGGILLLVFGAYNTWLVLDVAASAR
ncbi:MAG: calcium/sodium antiporter [Halieaceae bacterium]|jgi:cation:H+ antiporter|nr:calcium/sodium antiporter [Halieaceae bacterium]